MSQETTKIAMHDQPYCLVIMKEQQIKHYINRITNVAKVNIYSFAKCFLVMNYF